MTQSLTEDEVLLLMKEEFIRELPNEIIYFRNRIRMIDVIRCIWLSVKGGVHLSTDYPSATFEYMFTKYDDPKFFSDFIKFVTDAVYAHDL